MADELTDAEVMQPSKPPAATELSDEDVMKPASKASVFAPIAAAGAEAFKSQFEGSNEEFQKYQDYLAQNPLFGNRFIRQGAEAVGSLLSLTVKTLQGTLYGAGAMAGAAYQEAGASSGEANRLTRNIITTALVSAPELREMPVSTELTKAVAPALKEFQSTVIDPGIAKTASDILSGNLRAPPKGEVVVGYHGASDVIDKFDIEKTRLDRGIFFADNPELASKFAEGRATDSDSLRIFGEDDPEEIKKWVIQEAGETEGKRIGALLDKASSIEGTQAWQDLARHITDELKKISAFASESEGQAPNISKVNIDLGKTYIVDLGGKFDWNKEREAIDYARDNGYDSVTFKNSGEKGNYYSILNNEHIDPFWGARMMDEAKQLGVIDEKPLPTQVMAERPAPALQAQQDIPPRTMAAARTPDDKITMTPAGEPIASYQQRFEEWVGKIKAPNDVRDLIDRAAQENDYFPEAREGEVPASHVEKVAEAAGLDPTAIDREGLSTRFTRPAEIRAVEQALLQTTSDFRNAAAKLDADPSPENAAAMMEARVRRDYTLEYTLGLRSEWGRAGQALKDILDVTKREQTVTDLLRDKGESIDDLRDIARAIRSSNSPEGAARAMSGLRGKHPPGWFYWSWQQGLLSGLITHAGYAATNVGYILMQRILAPALSSVIGAIRGGERTFFGEAMVAPLGVIRSFPDAFRSAYQAAASNMRVPMKEELLLTARGAEPSKNQLARPYETAMLPDWGIWKSMADWLGVSPAVRSAAETTAAIGIGWPGRMANALHTFTKVMSKQAFMDSAAYHAAAKEGLSPLTGNFWDRYSHHLANPTDDVLRAGVDAAYSGSFMQKLGPVTGNISQALGKSPIRWVLPFRHVPFNLARATFEWSPVAFAGPEMRANLLGRNGAEAQNLAMSKVFAGSTLIGYFAMKYLSGQATGDYPVDPKERRDWQLQGKQPNSILSNGEWISLQRFGPPGRLANLGANIGSIIHGFAKGAGDLDHQVAEAIGKTIITAAEFVGSDVGFLFIHNLIDAMEDPRHAASFAANQVSSLIPWSTLLGQNASFMDPDMRKIEGIIAGIKYRIPGQRETLPPKRDPLYGDPVPNPGYHAIFRGSPMRIDLPKAEMERLDYHPGPPPNKVGGVKLTPQLYDEYEATAGPLVKRMLQNYTQSPGYRSLPDGVKANEFRALVAVGRSQARLAMLAHHPEIWQQGLEARKAAILGK